MEIFWKKSGKSYKQNQYPESFSSDPSNDEECAAFCHITSTDCMMYHFDSATSNCFAGTLTYTGGTWGKTGPLTMKVNQGMP